MCIPLGCPRARCDPTLQTFHELSKGLGAGGGDREGEFVHGHSVGHRQPVDPSVGNLPSEQLPQQNPITGRERGVGFQYSIIIQGSDNLIILTVVLEESINKSSKRTLTKLRLTNVNVIAY